MQRFAAKLEAHAASPAPCRVPRRPEVFVYSGSAFRPAATLAVLRHLGAQLPSLVQLLLRNQRELAGHGQVNRCRTAVQVIGSPSTVARKAHWRRKRAPSSGARCLFDGRPSGTRLKSGSANATASIIVVASGAVEVPFRSR